MQLVGHDQCLVGIVGLDDDLDMPLKKSPQMTRNATGPKGSD